MLDWTLIDGPHALLTAAETVAATRRGHADYPTAMGHALGFGVRLLEAAPPCARHTLDMAGDGQNNEGFGPQDAYNAYPFDEVTVNGLVVNAGDFEGELGLIPFYRAEVLHGRGAFLEIANGFADYELLELLLFGAKPRGDVKPLAKRLLKHFGTFEATIHADINELRKVDEVGDSVICCLKSVEESTQRLLRAPTKERPIIQSWTALLDYCRVAMGKETVEQLRILFLNHKNALIKDEVQQRGTIKSAVAITTAP